MKTTDERPQQPFQLSHIPVIGGADTGQNTTATGEQGSSAQTETPVNADNGDGTVEPVSGEIAIQEPITTGDEDPAITNLMNGGRAEIQVGDYPRAIEYFNEVLTRDPQHTGALYNISLIYRLSGDAENAVDYAKRAVDSDPNRLYVNQNLGYAYEMADETDLAIEAFEEELIRHPDVSSLAVVASKLSVMYSDKGLYEDAVDAALTAISLDPSEPSYHVLLGDTYMANKAYDQAVAAYSDGLELEPDSTEILIMLGDTEWEAGKQSEARDYYNRAIAIDDSVRESIPAERLLEDSATDANGETPPADQPM
ncbi:MAG: tetratricopeptide repeat protein [bacterium]|nr:tetratricopeptide repeat protein [bacterium]